MAVDRFRVVYLLSIVTACWLGACQWVLDLEEPEPASELASGCSTGAARPCGTDVGECSQGLQLCVDGTWEATCRNGVEPRDELCNHHDDDCDGSTDEGLQIGAPCDGEGVDGCAAGYADKDNDGVGAGARLTFQCAPPEGFVLTPGDCDDGDPLVHPGYLEICDGIDNDCNPGTVEDCSAGNCVLAKENGKVVLGYLFCKAAKSWTDARKVCYDNLFKLVRINDQAENTRLRTLADSVQSGQYWIGATDAGHQDDWRWDDGTPFWMGRVNGVAVGSAYQNWQPGSEPNNADNAEDCARFDGHWHDVACMNKMNFICERY